MSECNWSRNIGEVSVNFLVDVFLLSLTVTIDDCIELKGDVNVNFLPVMDVLDKFGVSVDM